MIPTVMAALAGAPTLPLRLVVTSSSTISVPAAAVSADIYVVYAGQDGYPDQPSQGPGAGGNGGNCTYQLGIPVLTRGTGGGGGVIMIGGILQCVVGTSSNSVSDVRDSTNLSVLNTPTVNIGGVGWGARGVGGGSVGGGGGACGTERGPGGAGDVLGNGGLPLTAGSILVPYVGPGGNSAASGIGWGAGGGGGNTTGNLAGGTGNPGGILIIFR